MDDQRPLPTIPTPPAQRWREVRLLYLPRTVFVVGVLTVAFLWSRWVTPATMVGEAVIAQAEVRSSQAGMLLGLKVIEFQKVQANEVVGHVAPVDPKVLEATLAVIRAEVGMLTTTLAGATDRQRVALEYERLQLDWMSARVEQAGLRGRLQLAESELARMEPLHRNGLITDENYEQYKTNRNMLAEQVTTQSQLVAKLEPSLKLLAPAAGSENMLTTDSALTAAIKVQDAKLKLAEQQLTPVPLVSPIAGVVSLVLRRTGEAVVAGEPILRITAAQPDRITGYVRQPMSFEPKVGMVVEVRTRGHLRKSAQSKITNVAAAMEPLTPTMISAMHLPPTPVPEPGLKIEVALPASLGLRPGEFVDLLSP